MTIHHDKPAYGKLASMHEDVGEGELLKMLETLNRDAELLDVVDENGIPTGETVDRATAHAKGIRHRTAHVWVFRRRKGGVQLLLQRRAANKDYSGCFDISAAGHLAAGEDPVSCALRELEEELGVRASARELFHCGRRTFCYREERKNGCFIDNQISEIYLFEFDQAEKDFVVDRNEVETLLWMSFGDCWEGVEKNTFRHCIYREELEIIQDYIKKNMI